MLAFLRRYQRYFLWVITIMIMISFSFFGTYGVMDQGLPSDPIAFETVGGREVRQSQLQAMMHFLSSDMVDTALLGAGNIFNDGVIAKDFLQTSLGAQIAEAFSAKLQPDLKTRMQKEQKAQFYHHPQAPFLSSETVWGYFVPQTTQHLATLRGMKSPIDLEAFRARMQLYTDQRNFPPQQLQRVLLHQEKQYEWLDHDPNLDYTDLSMFGYHTIEDWFGQQYIKVIAEFILNSASIAEERGYAVTSEEAMADLMQQAEKAYKQLPKAQQKVDSWQVYFQQQMSRLGLNETQLVETWRDVLLFRRLFDGVAHALFLDPLSFEDFSRYALTRIEGVRYTLPQELWIASENTLQKFETYLSLIADEQVKRPLALPTRFKDPQSLLKKYPELVQKRYQVAVSSVSGRHLQSQVSLQEMWNWQTDEANWAKLVQDFPELGLKNAKTTEERMKALDTLSKATRSRLDAMTRTTLVALHPEWLEEALKEAPQRTEIWTIPLAGKMQQLPDVVNSEVLIALLDRAPLGQETTSPALARYSPTGDIFYKIHLLEKPSQVEIAPFALVKDSEVLEKALKTNLESYWLKTRDREPSIYKQDGNYRPFEEVQGPVAASYFQPLFDALEKEYQIYLDAEGLAKEGEESPSRNRLASFRLYPYVQSVEKQMTTLAGQEKLWVRSTENNAKESVKDLPLTAKPVEEQFLLIKQPFNAIRRDMKASMQEEKLFALKPGDWSPLSALPEGKVAFFHILETGVASTTATILEQMQQVGGSLKQEAQALLMKNLLQTMALKETPPFAASTQAKEE